MSRSSASASPRVRAMMAAYEPGRWLRGICRNGVGRSLSVRTLWSAETPTISKSGPSDPRVRKVLPIAVWRGQ